MELQEQTVLSLNEKVLYFLVTLTVFTSGLSAIENASKFGLSDSAWRSGWLQNFSTEMMGAIATFVLFELVVAARQRLRDKEENTVQLEALREAVTQEIRLIQQANAIARIEATKNQPREVRQPIISELKILDLLRKADLSEANLQGANLVDANLQNANLSKVDLRDAELWYANLQGADVSDSDLRGANLVGANLEGADLVHVQFDDKTILPDHDPHGKQSIWTPNTDMKRFTDSSHPNFWRSNDPESPAYGG